MRIGIDHRPALFGRGGIAVYVRELVAALAACAPEDELELYAHRFRRPHGATGEAPAGDNVHLHERRVPAQALALAARAGLGADRLLGDVDVLHLTDYVALGSSKAPVVATIHDVLFEDVPACYPPVLRRRLRGVTSRLVRDAARLIVPSARSRDGLIAHFAADPARVHVVPHGCPALPKVAPAQEYGAYVLFAGTLQPRKNLGALLAAFDRVHGVHPDLRLVVAGPRGWMDEDLVAGIAARAFVAYEGQVSRERLSALYAGARFVAVPSREEGFGFPVLEAMTMGRAVLIGTGTACAELAGDGGLAVDVGDPEALAGGLLALLEDEDLAVRLGAAGRARSAAYSWARCARETRAVYEQAITG
jgi:glycosyltransferase involved in cell wall biosynthesis